MSANTKTDLDLAVIQARKEAEAVIGPMSDRERLAFRLGFNNGALHGFDRATTASMEAIRENLARRAKAPA